MINPHIMDRHEMEGMAQAVLDDAGHGEGWPVNLVQVARHLGLTLIPSDARGWELPGVISWDPSLPLDAQAFAVAHEIGHHLLRSHPERPVSAVAEEQAAHAVGAALMMPLRPFRALVREHAWDLAAIKPIVGASWAVVSRRLVAVHSGVVQCWDRSPGKPFLGQTWRATSPWLQPVLQRGPFAWERAFALQCLADRDHVREEALVSAYYVARNGYTRVLTVHGVEELEARVTLDEVRRASRWARDQGRRFAPASQG